MPLYRPIVTCSNLGSLTVFEITSRPIGLKTHIFSTPPFVHKFGNVSLQLLRLNFAFLDLWHVQKVFRYAQTDRLWQTKSISFRDRKSQKFYAASGGLRPLIPWPGALPLDPVGGSAPDDRYRLTLRALAMPPIAKSQIRHCTVHT